METKTREVAPELYQLYLPLPMRPSIVNVYLLKSGEEWALFDTGISSEESLTALDEIGCPPTAIRKLIATHHHPDHLGEFLQSQEKAQALEVALVLPAHGAVFADHRARARRLIQHHQYRKEEIRDLIRWHPKTAYDIALEVVGADNDRPLFHTIAATFGRASA